MRLWTIHPKYLDTAGLVALWREGLLARKVLLGETKGYKNHPQLERFKNTVSPIEIIDYYLSVVWQESSNRGYHFDSDKILVPVSSFKMQVSYGQVRYELQHLIRKLKKRKQLGMILPTLKFPLSLTTIVHPMFEVTNSEETESWEKVK